MTSYADAALHPLTTDADIECRVADLIGGACRGQLWFMFLDERNVQLPLLVPVADPPRSPSGAGGGLAAMVGGLVEAAGAASVVIVVERLGGRELTADDCDWALALHDACATTGVSLRALLLSHDKGVRWCAQDDYRF